jgi:hypothetical protein
MKLIIILFSPLSYYFIPPGYSLLSTLFSKALNIRYEVSYPYKITDKIPVLYTLIFMLSDSR